MMIAFRNYGGGVILVNPEYVQALYEPRDDKGGTFIVLHENEVRVQECILAVVQHLWRARQ